MFRRFYPEAPMPQTHSDSYSDLFSLGDVRIPFQMRKNPRAVAAGQATLELARRAQVLSAAPAGGIEGRTDLAAHLCPSAPQEGLVLGGLLVSWLFFLDDTYDRDAQFASDAAQVRWLREQPVTLLEGSAPPQAPTALQRYTVT